MEIIKNNTELKIELNINDNLNKNLNEKWTFKNKR